MVATLDMPKKKTRGRPRKPDKVDETSVKLPRALKEQLAVTMKWRKVSSMATYLAPVLQRFADSEEAIMRTDLNEKAKAPRA